MENREDIWIYGENHHNEFSPVVFQLINKALELRNIKGRGNVCVVICGKDNKVSADKLSNSGCDIIYTIDSPMLEEYDTSCYSKALVENVLKLKPDIFLFGATYEGRDLAPRIAAGLETGLTADCVGLDIDASTGILKQTIPGFGGKAYSIITCPNKKPQMATVRPGAMDIDNGDNSWIGGMKTGAKHISLNASLTPADKLTKILSSKPLRGGGLELSEARIICAGGRGLGSKENFKLLEEFSYAIGGSMGATRAATDDGLCDERYMIGQTGNIVKPEIYFTFGISGAIQHMIGIKNCKLLIAVNEDYLAPIFDMADYAIVGDARKTLECLIQRKDTVLKNINAVLGHSS